MIYTITLNPAIDHIIETNGFNKNETNYYDNDYILVGGKGINVSIVLNSLKENVISTGIIGKKNSSIFLEKFKKLGILNKFFYFNGKTRTNFKIKNLQINEETELNGLGTNVDKEHIEELLNYIKNSVKENDIVVASGSIPKGVENDIYFKIGEICNQKKVMFVLDSSKEQMKKGIESRPFLIKPNIEEICGILNFEYEQKEIDYMIKKLKKLGARNILLSMGSKGSIFFGENNENYRVGIAKGKLINSVGSGDSMIAGFVYGMSKGLEIEEILKYASASGGATAFTKWLGERKEIEKLSKEIKIERI